jgi:hypothetical protein
MRLPILFLAASAAALAAGSAAQAASVEVKDAVARVTVIPEARSDIKVEIVRANPRLPLQIRSLGGKTIVDGDLDRKIRSCGGMFGGRQPRVYVRGVGEVGWNEMPEVVIRTPRDVDLGVGGAVFGSVGRSASLDIRNSGCGDWTIGNVDGRLRLSDAGSGDARIGTARDMKIRVMGSGDVSTAEVAGPVDVDIAGSGDVSVAGVNGALDVHVAGSGDVRVAGGRATSMTVSVAGSGDVTFDGVADRLSARIMGSGDVHAREVRGDISKTVMGSGSVTVGR